MSRSVKLASLLACLVVTLATGAWGGPPKRAKPVPAPICKPGAPVGVNAVLDGGVAHLVLLFESPVEDARVEVRGTDGLTVSNAAGVPAGRFAAGAVVRFDVSYSSPPGGYLVVTIEGMYAGRPASEVRAFRVPGGTAAKQGTVTKDAAGQPIHVLPGETKTR